MSWYLAALQKFAVFGGRARRKEYWLFVLFNAIIVTVLFTLAFLPPSGPGEGLGLAISFLLILYVLAIAVPSLAVAIRRLHDLGKSGWWMLISFIPIAGAIWLLILFASDSQPGDNAYGPNPKGVPAPVSFAPKYAKKDTSPAHGGLFNGLGQAGHSNVQFDAEGKVTSTEARPGAWLHRQNGQFSYFNQKAGSLLDAAEILKQVSSIPSFTYYGVETPDGFLGRDIQGYYTPEPLRTKNINAPFHVRKGETIEAQDLNTFGVNMTGVAQMKLRGEYASLLMLMKCGKCGYESPVETQAGTFTRECYCCGTENTCHRMGVHVFLVGTGEVEI